MLNYTFIIFSYYPNEPGISAWPEIPHLMMTLLAILMGTTLILSTTPNCPLPEDTHSFVFALSYAIIGFQFAGHVTNSKLRDYMHLLLACIALAISIFSLLEIYYRRSVIVALLRPMSSVLAGTWFVQIAFRVFSPGHKPLLTFVNDEDGIGYITVVFCWH